MPSSRVFTLSDPEQYQMVLRGAGGIDVIPTAKGVFRAETTFGR